VSFFRGELASGLFNSDVEKHTMMAIGLSAEDTTEAIQKLQYGVENAGPSFQAELITISCINSPNNVTVSGPEVQLDILEVGLGQLGIFCRRLRVGLGYHSKQMHQISSKYREQIGQLEPRAKLMSGSPIMVSSVTGEIASAKYVCTSQYWVDNMIMPVNFLGALKLCCATSREVAIVKKLNRSHTQILVTHGLLEIGPHSALKAPIHEILALNKRDQEVVYTSALARGKPAIQTFLHALGTLFCAGFDFDQESIAFLASTSHKDMSVLAGIPPYQFDHSISYWEESQRNKDFRFRYHPMHDLLGAQVEFNTLEAKWRMVIREEELSWIKEHKVNGSMLYPAAGMLVMAIEALKQLLYDKPPIAFELEEVNFMAPILLSGLAASEGVEVQTALSSLGSAGGKTNTDFHFRIFSQRTGSTFEEVCRGGIRADYGRVISDVDDGRENTERMNKSRTDFHQACNSCKYGVETSVFYESIKSNIGIEYGLAFQRLDEIRSNQQGEAVAKLQSCSLACTEHTIHPTTLDGVFQLAFAALTHGVSTEIPTMIPRRLGKLWISNAGVGHWDVREEKIHTKAHIISARSATADAAVMSVEQAELLLRIKDLELSAVSSQNVPKRSDDAEHDCYHIEWKVDLDLMTVQQVQAYCEEIRNAAIEDVAIEWADNLDLLMFSFAARCSKDLKSTDYPVLPEFQNYASWLEDRLEEHLCEKDRERLWPVLLDQDHLRSLYDKVLPNPIGKLYILVGENLARILIGEVNPLQLLFEDDNLMADFYTELIARSTALEPIRRYLDCLVHKHPNLKILEVGAGTGASTAEILNVIDDSETGSRLETYVFTDISPSFFEKARAKLVAHEDRLEFKVLNIEEDPDLQEFKGAKYDIIVADNVIHATQAISVSLLNLRKLLKPGGKLFLKEMTTPLKIITGFFSGLLPGWWRATEEYRIAQQSPVISEEKWNIVLKEAGFTGIDVAFRDFATAKCYGWTFMISTLRASESKDINDDSNKSFPVIVLDPDSAVQTHAAQYICQELGMPESPASFASLDDVLAKNSTERQGYIFLNNMNENLLWDLDATVLKCLQKLVATAHTILWVTGGGGLFSKSPKFGIAGGLLRVVRQEENKVKVVLLSLDIEQSSARLDPATLHLITTAFIVDDVEPEYMQIDNRLCINRLVTARKIDQYIFEQLEEPVVLQAIGKKELRLGVRVPGLLDTMEFVEENVTSATLGPKEVIIEVQALGINFKDCLTVLGQVDSDIIGSECAGIVRDVGANAENDFKCGDRVVACALDSYRTYLRCCTQSVAKIPAEMSFAEATSFPTAFLTALYSLVHVARLQKGESILIHAAAGGTGQAAVQMASRIGAEVFTTVGSQEKKTLLMKRYGLSEHRIFYSRDASFADGVKRATKGRGVDVVLNSVSGRLLEASWECVAPFGRFIEIGRKDVDSRGRLPMYPFIKNLTFTGVDLTMVLDMKVELGHQLLTEVMALAQSGEIKPVFPLHSFPITDVERAFRFMQSGKSSGKIVLEINQSHVVPVSVSASLKFEEVLIAESCRL
jgi:NADPH:quinone reductase-like Zn-dependent oxidoreductase/ubiquinone/menaquinone biosynthesis C-methylase UbiE